MAILVVMGADATDVGAGGGGRAGGTMDEGRVRVKGGDTWIG